MERLIQELNRKSYEIRMAILDMCINAGTGHVSSSMSCADLLVALYYGGILKHDPKNPSWEGRDRFILSKGHASPVLYTILADCGYFDKSHLGCFAKEGGLLGVHPHVKIPGVEITSGSLGHGFGIAVGMALGARMSRDIHMTFALLGDGEMHEGSIWEAAMFAGHHRLNNLVALVDRNCICATDFTENIVSLEPVEDKWRAFGWETARIDGHSFKEIMGALRRVRGRRSVKPTVIIADTSKGEGVECIADNPFWHGVSLKGKDADEARACLKRRYGHE